MPWEDCGPVNLVYIPRGKLIPNFQLLFLVFIQLPHLKSMTVVHLGVFLLLMNINKYSPAFDFPLSYFLLFHYKIFANLLDSLQKVCSCMDLLIKVDVEYLILLTLV